MRPLRVLAAAATFAALLSQPMAAQDGRQFSDAWFWGAKAGALSYSSATGSSVAPLIGADWLITRSKGGIYLSFDESFFSGKGSYRDVDTNGAFEHFVDVKNLRRVSIAGMIFPMQSPRLHPYLGAGFAFHQLASASLMDGDAVTGARYAVALDSLQAKRSAFTPVFMGGVQARLSMFSLFAQATASPTQRDFFLSQLDGGRAFTFSIEGGLRYNIGSSIERMR